MTNKANRGNSPFPPSARAFAYLRDSGGDTQELSTVQQKTELLDWCAQHGVILEHVYIDEARQGSKDENRAALQEMMNALRHGAEVAGVIVWSNSRFARNATHAQFYRSEIRKLGYIYHSLNDKTSDGPEGIIFEALIDYKNQQFLEDLAIDTKRGLRQLVEQYGCVPGVPPRGFRRVPVEIGQRRNGKARTAHRWEIDPDIAPRVRQAFEMRAAGASLGQIQEETRLYGSINSYRTFWPNQLYIGRLVFGDLVIEDYCEPIVPREIWDAVQEIQKHYAGHHHVSAKSPNHPRRVGSNYLLSGLAHCARCGSPLFGRSTKRKNGPRYIAYYCTRAYRQRDCTKQRIPGEALEQAVIAQLRDVYLKPEYLGAVHAELLAQNAGRMERLEATRRELSAELGTLRRQITHVTDAISAAGHSRSLLERLNHLEADETSVLTRLAENENQRLASVPPAIGLDRLAAGIAHIDAAMHSADIETKRAILRSIVHRVDVDRDNRRLFGSITVYYPFGDDSPSNAAPPHQVDRWGGVMPISRGPSGPPRYRHEIAFEARARYKSPSRK